MIIVFRSYFSAVSEKKARKKDAIRIRIVKKVDKTFIPRSIFLVLFGFCFANNKNFNSIIEQT